MPLLTSTLVVLFAVAKMGGGGIAPPAGAAGGDNVSMLSSEVVAATAGGGVSGRVSGGGDAMSPELTALAEGGAWGAVYDALKGPCMARAAELQQIKAAVGSGKKGGGEDAAAVSADLTACLDNMARCAEVSSARLYVRAGGGRKGAFLCCVLLCRRQTTVQPLEEFFSVGLYVQVTGRKQS